MEPHNESQKPTDLPREQKEHKRRFQIVKLEERIAPKKGGNHLFTEGPCHKFTDPKFGCP
jgi:hypothetical protein